MGVVNSVMSFFGFGSSDGKSESAPRPKQPAPRPRRAADMSEIVTLDPESYVDAKEVAAHFRSGVPVIVNIGSMSEADAKRMLDFMLGLKEALEGQIRRVTPKVFLLSPSHVEVNDGEPEATDADQLLD